MTVSFFHKVFNEENLKNLFPANRADRFFDALFGDAEEGAYDICLEFLSVGDDRLKFEFQLKRRPGKCLACNLTYGLPDVFSRHPVIDLKGLIRDMNQLIDGKGKCTDWKLGTTREVSRELHVVPLTVFMEV